MGVWNYLYVMRTQNTESRHANMRRLVDRLRLETE
jgi:hypothetical protein